MPLTLFFGGLNANHSTTDPDQPGQGDRALCQARRDLGQRGQNPRARLCGAQGGAGAADALEEQHLFPVLRKRKETKDLVSDALSDNKGTRKALTELERTPKESEEFASKVAELSKAFQQHVRDERKELLPAVLKALDDEEAEAIVEKIEGAKAEVEEAKRAEAEGAGPQPAKSASRPRPWPARSASGSRPCGKRPERQQRCPGQRRSAAAGG